MRKKIIPICAFTLACSLFCTSCIGKFALTHKVLGWNHQISNKFVNELVFVGFWILPIYEISALADLLVINSIEFWSGSNPITLLRGMKTDIQSLMKLTSLSPTFVLIKTRTRGLLPRRRAMSLFLHLSTTHT